jgi:hypothetical protein
MPTWTAESVPELDEISGVVHDAWFDVDEVVRDRAAGTVTVPFAQDPGQFDADEQCRDDPRPQLLRRTWRYTEERVPFIRGVLRVGHVVALSEDDEFGDAAMLLGTSYDEATRRVTVRAASGNVTAVVERLGVTVEIHPHEVALYVRRRRSRLSGAESDVPLWDARGT